MIIDCIEMNCIHLRHQKIDTGGLMFYCACEDDLCAGCIPEPYDSNKTYNKYMGNVSFAKERHEWKKNQIKIETEDAPNEK